jgi:hypothetical protein
MSSDDVVSVLKLSGFEEVLNTSLFYCPYGCTVLGNTTSNTHAAIYDDGKAVYGIAPLGNAVDLREEQISELEAVLLRIYGSDIAGWFHKTYPNMKGPNGTFGGTSSDTVTIYDVSLEFVFWGDSGKNTGTVTITPKAAGSLSGSPASTEAP